MPTTPLLRVLLAATVAASVLVAPLVTPPAAGQEHSPVDISVPASHGDPTDVDAYLEDPGVSREHALPARATLHPFPDGPAARADLDRPRTQPVASDRVRSLDGDWRFRWFLDDADAPAGFEEESHDDASWDSIAVPSSWQARGFGHPIYRNIAIDFGLYDEPRVPDDIDPVGLYRRTFDVPADWDDRVVLRFEGVTTAFFVWVNGSYVGYAEGAYLPSEFDVTDAIRPGGTNTVAVRVHRWADATYLQNMDAWSFTGIDRSVSIESRPTRHIRDVIVRTTLAAGEDGRRRDASVTADVELSGTDVAGTTLGVQVLDPDGVTVLDTQIAVTGPTVPVAFDLEDAPLWSDEHPELHGLVLELRDATGTPLEATSVRFGVRELTVVDQQVHLNGRRVVFKGVNRHEHSAGFGRHVPPAEVLSELQLMKRFNINSVRTSHYPPDPVFLDLADELGLLVQVEVDGETHFRELCPNCLADQPEWIDLFVERMDAMVRRDRNHPSVVFWSTGNEAGTGAAHGQMATVTRELDPTRLLMHQDNGSAGSLPYLVGGTPTNDDGEAPFVDVVGPRYPNPALLAERAQLETQPVVMGEYAHAMGNSLGNFDEFWDLVWSVPKIQGGWIWDWVDQGLPLPRRLLDDASPLDLPVAMLGRPRLVPDGNGGRAVQFSAVDDWVEVFNDVAFDELGDELTVEARVQGRAYQGVTGGPFAYPPGAFTAVTGPIDAFPGEYVVDKGEQWGIRQTSADTIEFYVTTPDGQVVAGAPVPADFATTWHHVAGVYDGTTVSLFIDGVEVASEPATGPVPRDELNHPVHIGRSPEVFLGAANQAGRTSDNLVDDVRVHRAVLAPRDLGTLPGPGADTLLWLDFDAERTDGTLVAYGADEFVANGLVHEDRTVQPELWQVKRSHAPVRVTAIDAGAGELRVHNRYSFRDLSELDVTWELALDGEVVADGPLDLTVPPLSTADLEVPLPAVPAGVDAWLTVRTREPTATNWASAGHEVAFDTFQLAAAPAATPDTGPAPDVTDRGGGDVTVTAGDVTYGFVDGALTSIDPGDGELLTAPVSLNAYRALVSNDEFLVTLAPGPHGIEWRAAGLDRLVRELRDVEVEPGAPAVVRVEEFWALPDDPSSGFAVTSTHAIHGSGELGLDVTIEPGGDGVTGLQFLPRLGLRLDVDRALDTLEWFGRGPFSTYVDRRTGAEVSRWSEPVADRFVPYLTPQEYGHITDVREVALRAADGRSLDVLDASGDRFEAGAMHLDQDRLDRMAFAFQAVDQGAVSLFVDAAMTGVGGTFQQPLPQYRVPADQPQSLSLVLRPASAGEGASDDRTLATTGGGPGPLGLVLLAVLAVVLAHRARRGRQQARSGGAAA